MRLGYALSGLCLLVALGRFQIEASGMPKAAPTAIPGLQGSSVFLKLLEPIAPQQRKEKDAGKKERVEIVHSTLGDLLKDPKNEGLKAVKVIGTQKRLKTDKTHFTRVRWEEVSLEVGDVSRGLTGTEPILLKESVEKPLESSFVQKAESIEAGTPVEAKGDVDSLLAAARTLIVRAQKQGFKGDPLAVKNTQGTGGVGNPQDKIFRKPRDSATVQVHLPAASTKGTGRREGGVGTGRLPQDTLNPGLSGSSLADGGSSTLSRTREGFYGSSSSNESSPQNPSNFSSNPPRYPRSSPAGFSSGSSLTLDSGWVPGRSTRAREETRETAGNGSSTPLTSVPLSAVSSNSSPSEKEEGIPTGQRGALGQAQDVSHAEHSVIREGRGISPIQRKEGPSAVGSVEPSGDVTKEGEGVASPLSAANRSPGHGLSGFLDHEQEEGEQVAAVSSTRPSTEERGATAPVIRIDYDFRSCQPRIDWSIRQVILQSKAITFRDNERVSETECLDTEKRFAIQKDYSHIDCYDQVEKKDHPTSAQDFGFAYATYRPYWLNEAKEREYLKEPQRDEDHPFALQEEGGQCVYAVDVDARQAKSQSELVYYNRLKQRVVVEACRPSVFGKITPITATTRGCGLVHQFDQNRSIQQQRLVYSIDGIEREALPCHDTGDWLEHQFDIKVCKPIVDESAKKQQPFAKRYVVTDQGKIYISEPEPYGDQVPLLMDAAACRHQPYHHDLAAGQSFVNVRWYYEHLHGKKYVTACQPSTQTFDHQKTLVSHVHDDANKVSHPKIEVSFDHEGRKVIVTPAKVDEAATAAPYARVGERAETKAYNTRMSDRCYQERRFRQKAVFRRVDGSEFEQDNQDKVDSVDLCVRTKEQRYENSHTSVLTLWQGEGDFLAGGDTVIPKWVEKYPWGSGCWLMYGYAPFDSHHLHSVFGIYGVLYHTDKILERVKTVYPDKSLDYSPWDWTGYYRDYGMQGAHSGYGGAQPPYTEKVWHHTDRIYPSRHELF